jgi:hypothetical protein
MLHEVILRQLATQFPVISLCYGRNFVRVRILIWVKNKDKYICAVKAHLHNTIAISCTIILFNTHLRDWVRVRFWRMKTTADALFPYISLWQNLKCVIFIRIYSSTYARIRIINDWQYLCRWSFNITILTHKCRHKYIFHCQVLDPNPWQPLS